MCPFLWRCLMDVLWCFTRFHDGFYDGSCNGFMSWSGYWLDEGFLDVLCFVFSLWDLQCSKFESQVFLHHIFLFLPPAEGRSSRRRLDVVPGSHWKERGWFAAGFWHGGTESIEQEKNPDNPKDVFVIMGKPGREWQRCQKSNVESRENLRHGFEQDLAAWRQKPCSLPCEKGKKPNIRLYKNLGKP